MTDISETYFKITSVIIYSYTCECTLASYEQSDYDTILNSRVYFFNS